MKPRISVILTSFNHGNYIKQAIDSVLEQSFKDIELIIWDDASTDHSWEVIQSFHDPRIKAFRNQTNSGPVYGVNKAIAEIAQGEFIAIHHSDDSWCRNKLLKQIKIVESTSEIGAIFTWVEYIDENNKIIKNDWCNTNANRWELLRGIYYGINRLAHPSVLIRKSCYESVGLYKHGLTQTADVEMWSRLLLNYDIFIIEEKLTKHRLFSDGSNSSGSTNNSAIRTQNEWNILRKNFLNHCLPEMFAKIFPEMAPKTKDSYDQMRPLLAIAALRPEAPASAWGFGLNLLHEHFAHEQKAPEINNHYNYLNLENDSGCFDVYGINSQINNKELNKKIKDLEKINNELSEKLSIINENYLNAENSLKNIQSHPAVKIINRVLNGRLF